MARRLAAGLLLPLLSGCSIAVSLYVVNRSSKPVLLEYSCISCPAPTIIPASRLGHGTNASARARLAPAFVEGRVDSVLIYRVIIPPDSAIGLGFPSAAQEPESFYAGPDRRAWHITIVAGQDTIRHSGRDLFTAFTHYRASYWVLEVPASP